MAMDSSIECNARAAVVELRMENLTPTSLLLGFLHWLYATNTAMKVLRISGPLVFGNPLAYGDGGGSAEDDG